MIDIETQNLIDDLRAELKSVRDEWQLARDNLLWPALIGPGRLRFGSNIMQLDNTGVQFQTTSDQGTIFWVPSFSLTPTSVYPRSQLNGFSTSSVSAATLQTLGASGQYATVTSYSGIINTQPNVTLTTQTTGGVVSQIDMYSTDAGSDAAVLIHTGSISSPLSAQTQITSNQNDYDVGARLRSAVSISSDAARDITGIDATGVLDGALLFIQNTGSFAITLKDASGSSAAANQFAFSGDLILAADDGCLLQYNGTSDRWRCIGKSVASAGGSILTDTAWAAKGDLVAGTANDTAQIVGVGQDGYVLKADSTQTPGVKWKGMLEVSNQTGTYNAVQGEYVRCSGTFTVTLPNANANDYIVVGNVGTGVITINTTAGATFDYYSTGMASGSITILPGERLQFLFYTTGSWQVF